MKFKTPAWIICEGCGAEGETVRETRSFGQGEAHRIHHPEGWTQDVVQPSGVTVVSAGRQVQLDPFDSAERIASAIGQPVPVFRCPACSARAKDRAVTLLDAFGAAKDGAA